MDHRAQQSLIATPSVGYRQITSVKSCKAAGKVVQNGTLTLKSESRLWALGSGKSLARALELWPPEALSPEP